MSRKNRIASRIIIPLAAFLIGLLVATTATGQTATSGQLMISEFRLRGPNGATDEFIEIYNASGSGRTVTSAVRHGASDGYAIVASDGELRCKVPNGTIIPNRGHYLCANSDGYGLASRRDASARPDDDVGGNGGSGTVPRFGRHLVLAPNLKRALLGNTLTAWSRDVYDRFRRRTPCRCSGRLAFAATAAQKRRLRGLSFSAGRQNSVCPNAGEKDERDTRRRLGVETARIPMLANGR